MRGLKSIFLLEKMSDYHLSNGWFQLKLQKLKFFIKFLI